jgi:hypothetical protein
MVAKLKAIKAELQRRKHDRTVTVGAWLRIVVLGYYQYHAVPGNTTQLRIFQRLLTGYGGVFSSDAVSEHRCAGSDLPHY